MVHGSDRGGGGARGQPGKEVGYPWGDAASSGRPAVPKMMAEVEELPGMGCCGGGSRLVGWVVLGQGDAGEEVSWRRWNAWGGDPGGDATAMVGVWMDVATCRRRRG